jgi:hypothetical protein
VEEAVRNGCEDRETGDRIVLKDSGLTCSEAFGIYVLLPSGGSKEVQKLEGNGSAWLCRGFPRVSSEIRYICEMGWRHFVVKAGS